MQTVRRKHSGCQARQHLLVVCKAWLVCVTYSVLSSFQEAGPHKQCFMLHTLMQHAPCL